MRRLSFAALLFAPALVFAQSATERGEMQRKAGTAFALQGNADSALASLYRARTVAETLHDSSLLAAALRDASEVHRVYLGCNDSSFALLQQAVASSIVGDRAAGQVLVRQLAAAGRLAEARVVQAELYADLKEDVPRSVTRESVGFLTGQAHVQKAAGQPAAALASLRSARLIADRLSNGDDVERATAKPLAEVNAQNYWVTYDMADLMLTSKAAGVMNLVQGRALMDAVAKTDDAPDRGNERRFSVFRLADRLAIKAWRCSLDGQRCVVPAPRGCRP